MSFASLNTSDDASSLNRILFIGESRAAKEKRLFCSVAFPIFYAAIGSTGSARNAKEDEKSGGAI